MNMPADWEGTEDFILSNDNLIIKTVMEGTPEFIKVQIEFLLSQPDSMVTRIQRIQNRKLWRVYQTEVEEVTRKLGKAP